MKGTEVQHDTVSLSNLLEKIEKRGQPRLKPFSEKVKSQFSFTQAASVPAQSNFCVVVKGEITAVFTPEANPAIWNPQASARKGVRNSKSSKTQKQMNSLAGARF